MKKISNKDALKYRTERKEKGERGGGGRKEASKQALETSQLQLPHHGLGFSERLKVTFNEHF